MSYITWEYYCSLSDTVTEEEFKKLNNRAEVFLDVFTHNRAKKFMDSYVEDKKLIFVDLPGYGFAKVSKQERERWGRMIEEYLNEREQLIQVVLLVDMRHKPTNDDIMMFNWITESGYNPVVIATKKDKVKPSQREDALKLIKDTLGIEDVIAFSSEKGDGVDEVWSLFKQMIGVEE